MFFKNPTRNNRKSYVNIYITFRWESFSKHNNKQTLETDERERFGGKIKQALGKPPGIFDKPRLTSTPSVPERGTTVPPALGTILGSSSPHPTVVSTPSRWFIRLTLLLVPLVYVCSRIGNSFPKAYISLSGLPACKLSPTSNPFFTWSFYSSA